MPPSPEGISCADCLCTERSLFSTLYNVHYHALLRYSTLLHLTMVEPPSGSAADGWFSCSDAVGIMGLMSIQHVILVSLSAYV